MLLNKSLSILVPILILTALKNGSRTITFNRFDVLNGNVKQLIQTDSTISNFHLSDTTDFDQDGNATETREGDGHVVIILTKYVNKYDSSGRKLETIAIPSGGTSKTVYTYNVNGQVVSSEDSLSNDKISYKYDMNSQPIELVVSTGQRVQFSELNKYKDNLLTVTDLYQHGTRLKDRYYYKYFSLDKQGNWTKRKETWKNENGKVERVSIQLRKFLYY